MTRTDYRQGDKTVIRRDYRQGEMAVTRTDYRQGEKTGREDSDKERLQAGR